MTVGLSGAHGAPHRWRYYYYCRLTAYEGISRDGTPPLVATGVRSPCGGNGAAFCAPATQSIAGTAAAMGPARNAFVRMHARARALTRASGTNFQLIFCRIRYSRCYNDSVSYVDLDVSQRQSPVITPGRSPMSPNMSDSSASSEWHSSKPMPPNMNTPAPPPPPPPAAVLLSTARCRFDGQLERQASWPGWPKPGASRCCQDSCARSNRHKSV